MYQVVALVLTLGLVVLLALGVPVGTVKFRLHQARKKLRVELDAPEGEGANVQ
mgnify:CR=1 FL=1